MAYALVRIVESFIYADVIAGEDPDIDKAVEVLRLSCARTAQSDTGFALASARDDAGWQ